MRPGWQLYWTSLVSGFSSAAARHARHGNEIGNFEKIHGVSLSGERKYLAIVGDCTKTTLQL